MKSAFLIFMIVVLVFTILLGILIWRQSFRIEKRHLLPNSDRRNTSSNLKQSDKCNYSKIWKINQMNLIMKLVNNLVNNQVVLLLLSN